MPVTHRACTWQEGVHRGGEHKAAVEAQLKSTRKLLADERRAKDAAAKSDWSSAYQLFERLLSTAGTALLPAPPLWLSVADRARGTHQLASRARTGVARSRTVWRSGSGSPVGDC